MVRKDRRNGGMNRPAILLAACIAVIVSHCLPI
jgi:hypothetical protein